MAVRYCAERNTANSRKLAKGILQYDIPKMVFEDADDDQIKLAIYHHINKPSTPEWEELRRNLKDELMDKNLLE